MPVNRLPAEEKTARNLAVAEGLLVTLIVGSTFPVVKIALGYLGPLTITGLRFWLGFLLLLPFVLRRGEAGRWSTRLWLRFLTIGFSFYVVGNGAVYLGLKHIPATTCSLLLNLVPLLVLLGGVLWLQEVPTRWQLAGVLVGLAGSGLFFSPGLEAGEPLGIAMVAIGLAGVASFGLVGRELARERRVDTLSLTAIPLAIGGGILLIIAFCVEGLPEFSLTGGGLVLWLAVVNTVCAYALYNHVLRTLAAFELGIILNLSPLVTACWAWILLDERLGLIQIMGMVTVILGVVLVQWGKSRP